MAMEVRSCEVVKLEVEKAFSVEIVVIAERGL
jgi:hypothetical protein